MTNQINHIVEHLFHKKSLDDVSVYEIERFIATHPYFAAGHLLLAKKTLLSDPEKTSDKIATTSLYYNNPLWLQWLLDQDITSYLQKHEEKPMGGHHENISREFPIDTSTSGDHQYEDTITQAEENGDPNTHNSFPSDETLQEDRFSPGSETIPGAAPSVFQQEVVNDYRDDLLTESESESELSAILEPKQESEFESHEEDVHTIKPEVTTEHVQFDDSTDKSGSTLSDIQEPAEQTSILPGASKSEGDDDDRDQLQETKTTIENDIEQPQQPDLEDEESRATAASIEKTLTTATLIPTRAEIEKGEFTFEPYHTIDYFASQGIKLQQSDLSRDKFGKQLRSFTEWLKSMKRLPQTVVEANMDEAAQQSIQRIAEHSFEEKDIVTETMAEVWIKQGNKEKAIDTLHKLSLLYPSKSHYFAAKIEQLKAS